LGCISAYHAAIGDDEVPLNAYVTFPTTSTYQYGVQWVLQSEAQKK